MCSGTIGLILFDEDHDSNSFFPGRDGQPLPQLVLVCDV